MGPAVPEKKCSSKMLSDRLIGICAGDVIASKNFCGYFCRGSFGGWSATGGRWKLGGGGCVEAPRSPTNPTHSTQLGAFKSDNLRHSQICETFLQHFVLSTEYMWVMQIECNGWT